MVLYLTRCKEATDHSNTEIIQKGGNTKDKEQQTKNKQMKKRKIHTHTHSDTDSVRELINL